jgi:hypothetical protein
MRQITPTIRGLVVAALLSLVGAGCGAPRSAPAERYQAYYHRDGDLRPANPVSRDDAIESIRGRCPRGYHIHRERRPGRRRRLGVIEYSCAGETLRLRGTRTALENVAGTRQRRDRRAESMQRADEGVASDIDHSFETRTSVIASGRRAVSVATACDEWPGDEYSAAV